VRSCNPRLGRFDALDELPWDLVKLAHAHGMLGEVDCALLVYAAPSAAWERARFRDIVNGGELRPMRHVLEKRQAWKSQPPDSDREGSNRGHSRLCPDRRAHGHLDGALMALRRDPPTRREG
jgi:hypothetical protein